MDGPQDSGRLVALAQKVAQRRHKGIAKTLVEVAGPFPIAGMAAWSNDWHVLRPCPYPHLHQGVDIFAERGTPVVAVAGAVVSQKVNEPVAGLAVEITDGDGTEYLYAHLSAFAPKLEVGERVELGQLLGFVGNTGNARHTSPHVHFEVQPGGIAVPPKPYVDRWLLVAEARARRLATAPKRVRKHRDRRAERRVVAPRPTRALVDADTGTVWLAVNRLPQTPPESPYGLPAIAGALAAAFVMTFVARVSGRSGRRRDAVRASDRAEVRAVGAPAASPIGSVRTYVGMVEPSDALVPAAPHVSVSRGPSKTRHRDLAVVGLALFVALAIFYSARKAS